MNFDAFHPFMNSQNIVVQKNTSSNENVLVTKLLSGLKLK